MNYLQIICVNPGNGHTAPLHFDSYIIDDLPSLRNSELYFPQGFGQFNKLQAEILLKNTVDKRHRPKLGAYCRIHSFWIRIFLSASTSADVTVKLYPSTV